MWSAGQRFALLLVMLGITTTQVWGQRVVIPDCTVGVKEIEVPAEDAGLLMKVAVREGSTVKKDAELALIDDRRALAQRELAEAELQSARDQAENDINVRLARKASAVSEAEYQAAVAANRRKTGAVSEAEVRRLFFEWERSKLAIEKAEMDQKLSKYTVTSRGAEWKVANDAVDRRIIRSPVNGKVVEIRRNAGEWVNSGDTVMRVLRMDRLLVDGFLNINQHAPEEIRAQRVTARVALPRGRTATFSGRIVFVDPQVQADGEYHVQAEIDNMQDTAGEWVLYPGLDAVLTIP